MAHRIEIALESFSEDQHRKVRNFIEDVWFNLSQRGWAEMENFDRRIKPGAKFMFSFPARDSHQATTLISRLVREHFMESLTTVTHAKEKADG